MKGFWRGIAKGKRSHGESGLVEVVLGNVRIGGVNSRPCSAVRPRVPASRHLGTGYGEMRDLQAQDKDQCDGDENDQVKPPESLVVGLEFAAKCRLFPWW